MVKYVNMTDDLAAAIDAVVESAKDSETNTLRWKSRAEFVEEASKDLLRRTSKAREAKA